MQNYKSQNKANKAKDKKTRSGFSSDEGHAAISFSAQVYSDSPAALATAF